MRPAAEEVVCSGSVAKGKNTTGSKMSLEAGDPMWGSDDV
jgi:hypothetical protein